jgi:hypothetical protein
VIAGPAPSTTAPRPCHTGASLAARLGGGRVAALDLRGRGDKQPFDGNWVERSCSFRAEGEDDGARHDVAGDEPLSN